MRLEKADQRAQQCRLARPRAQLIRPDSGQVEEALRPAPVPERCRKRGQTQDGGIAGGMIWRRRLHGLGIAAAESKGKRLAKILIVEDNALNIKLFCDLLAAHGHQPEAVTDSRNAIDAARNSVPDLVITDIQLPHVSGLELIRLIRADEQLAHIPIMAVTAYSAPGDEERIRAAGAQEYVSKPISVVKFAQAVEALLSEGKVEATP